MAAASGRYFALFDARPALGRFLTPDDDRMPTGSPVVVLANAYWQSNFGGRRDALRRQLRVGSMLFTIVGVAPKGFVVGREDGPGNVSTPLGNRLERAPRRSREHNESKPLRG